MEKYNHLLEQIQLILEQKGNTGIQDIVDLLQKNISHYSWVGIYLVRNTMLHLGPWAGTHATEHTEIPIGQGICGAAVESGKTEVIPDVHADHRYLSCFLWTQSEIVVPIRYHGDIIGEIDIDSDRKDAFSADDERFLETIAEMLGPHVHMP
jgi:GAF domain-containing protein